jgi:hypothetical protein
MLEQVLPQRVHHVDAGNRRVGGSRAEGVGHQAARQEDARERRLVCDRDVHILTRMPDPV